MAEDQAQPQETPQSEPAPEAPKAEEPQVEAPKAEAPEPEAPEAKAPKAKAPKAKAPKAEEPEVEAPKAEEPKVEKRPAEAPAPAPSIPAPPVPPGSFYFWGTGRRKSAVARVRIRPGTGKFIVNKREANQYFDHDSDREAILAPLVAARMLRSWDIWANVRGGGYTGQAGAVTLGLARALAKAVPDAEGALRGEGLMTRDARMVERKKYGQPGARKRFQFSKR